jgi:sortase (surface protein transpeptidase)
MRKSTTKARHPHTIASVALGVALSLSAAPGPGVVIAGAPADQDPRTEPYQARPIVPVSAVAAGTSARDRHAPPVTIRIPGVDIESSLVSLGLDADGTLEVPSDFATAGWYMNGPVPGDPGRAVIAGHVDSSTGPAVFYRLREIEPGEIIEVTRTDGSIAEFVVTALEQHDKDAFPTERVYGPSPRSELRVITCGGTFDPSVGHYDDNIIVFAELAR